MEHIRDNAALRFFLARVRDRVRVYRVALHGAADKLTLLAAALIPPVVLYPVVHKLRDRVQRLSRDTCRFRYINGAVGIASYLREERHCPAQKLGFAGRNTGIYTLFQPAEFVVYRGRCAGKKLPEALGSELLDILVRILGIGYIQHPCGYTRFREQIYCFHCGVLPRAVRVIGYDDLLRVLLHNVRLLRCYSRAERGNGVVEARLIERDNVHIPLAEYQELLFCIFCEIEREQILALAENKCLVAVQILGGSILFKRPAAESDHVSASVDYREHHSAPELVIDRVVPPHKQGSGFHFVVGVAFRPQIILKIMPAVRRKSEPVFLYRIRGELPPRKIVKSLSSLRREQHIAEIPRGFTVHTEQPCAHIGSAVVRLVRH